MIAQKYNLKEELYSFRGKEFYCDAETIRHLNYALALNHSSERYEKITVNRRTTSKSQ